MSHDPPETHDTCLMSPGEKKTRKGTGRCFRSASPVQRKATFVNNRSSKLFFFNPEGIYVLLSLFYNNLHTTLNFTRNLPMI